MANKVFGFIKHEHCLLYFYHYFAYLDLYFSNIAYVYFPLDIWHTFGIPLAIYLSNAGRSFVNFCVNF